MLAKLKRPAFIDGRRYRAGKPELFPNGTKLPSDAEVLDANAEPETKKKKPKGDNTKALSELKQEELPLPPKPAK